ncbi:MAG: hypothetical protein ACK5Q5_06560 [Planctomycetaceae bacterium]
MLVVTTSYGVLAAVCGLLGCAAVICCCDAAGIRLLREFSRAQAIVACVMIVPVICLVAASTGVVARARILESHYWAMHIRWSDVLGCVHQWRAALGFWSSDLAEMTASVAGVGLILLLVFMGLTRLMSPTTLMLVIWVVAISVCLLVWEQSRAQPVMVTHLLVCQHYLLQLLLVWVVGDLSQRFGVVFAGIASWAGICGIVLPCVVTISGSNIHGDLVTRRAADEVIATSGDVDVLLFAGSRTYALFEMYLPESLGAKTKVYLRGEPFPDNFPYRTRIPASNCVRKHDLAMLADQRVVYVQLEAAQSITIDVSPWTTSALHIYGHPCNSIGNIQVAELRPRRDPVVE